MLMKCVGVSARGQVSVIALADRQLHAAAQRGLDRRLIDFAVTLRGVAVADLEQRARHVHRNPQRRAGHQFLVVEVAGVNARADCC